MFVLHSVSFFSRQNFSLKNFINRSKMDAAEGQVVGVRSLDSWERYLLSAKESERLVVVDFTASWCGPCRFIAPILAELAKKEPQVLFLKVDIDELQSVSTEWAVTSVPTFIFLKEGNMIDKVVGARKEALTAAISKHSGGATTSA